MTAMDTRKVVKRLRNAGFSDEQADAVTDVLMDTRDYDDSRLATKADIEMLRTEIASAKLDLVKWFVPMMIGQTAAIVALLKLL